MNVLAVSSVGKNAPSFHSPGVTMPAPAAYVRASCGSAVLKGLEGILVLGVRLWGGNGLSFKE